MPYKFPIEVPTEEQYLFLQAIDSDFEFHLALRDCGIMLCKLPKKKKKNQEWFGLVVKWYINLLGLINAKYTHLEGQ